MGNGKPFVRNRDYILVSLTNWTMKVWTETQFCILAGTGIQKSMTHVLKTHRLV